MTYRPDIQGLRGIAVIAIVFWHIGVPGFSGGFVGVDVFFVISGFLITGQLIAARETRVVDLLRDFYERRARRILPALLFMLVAVLALGWLVLLPFREQQDLARSAIATTLFVSNIFFWRERSDYFAPSHELQPLIHTWSLGVEEQFYLCWPLFIVALVVVERRIGLRNCRPLVLGLALLSICSFAASVWSVSATSTASFFLMPFRLWEFGVGGLLVFAMGEDGQPRLPGVFATLGLICIATAVLTFDLKTPFPGAAAALPVAGTALVIAAAHREPKSAGYRALSLPVLIFTGTVSYSWYLWHWPLISVARIADLGGHNFLRDGGLAALAFGIAFLSTKYLENPYRQRSRVGRPWLVATCSSFSVLTVGLAWFLWTSADREFQVIEKTLRAPSKGCMLSSRNIELGPRSLCILADGDKVSVFLVGDSHANHWSPAIASWARGSNIIAAERTMAFCNVLAAAHADNDARIGSRAEYSAACTGFGKRVMDEIRAAAASGKPTGVVISTYWVRHPRPERLEMWRTNLDTALGELLKLGVRVLIIGPSPSFPFSVPACVIRLKEERCRLARAQYDAIKAGAEKMLASLVGAHPQVKYWSPAAVFCDATWCYPTKDGKLMFADFNHVTPFAAQTAIQKDLMASLTWLGEKRSPDR